MASGKSEGSATDYVVHHLTNLKLDLTTMTLDPYATGFWVVHIDSICLLYTSPSPRDLSTSRMPSSA